MLLAQTALMGICTHLVRTGEGLLVSRFVIIALIGSLKLQVFHFFLPYQVAYPACVRLLRKDVIRLILQLCVS